MGKTRIIAETGAGQARCRDCTGVCAAQSAASTWVLVDCERQNQRVPYAFDGCGSYSGTPVLPLKDACNEAMRDWTANYKDTHYILGTAAGLHPFPNGVREFQRMIGEEPKRKFLEAEGRLPDAVVACVGGGSNAIGMFNLH